MHSNNPEEEYRELNNNLRFYANMRFAQLTLFSAITAAFLTIIFTITPPLSESTRSILKVGGLISTIVLWVMEERSSGYGMHFYKRIVELEPLLGYKIWQGRKMRTKAIFSATNAVRVLYFFVAAFWLLSIIYRSSF